MLTLLQMSLISPPLPTSTHPHIPLLWPSPQRILQCQHQFYRNCLVEVLITDYLHTLHEILCHSVFLETFNTQSRRYYLKFYVGWKFTKAIMTKITYPLSTWKPRRGIIFHLGLHYGVNYVHQFNKYFNTK